VIVITHQDIEQHRPALVAWAEANGLSPKVIDPHSLVIETIHGRPVILYTEHQTGRNGMPLIDPDHTDQVLRVRRSRVMLHGLPEGMGRRLCACTLGRLDPDCGDHSTPADTGVATHE
jgi:hypothetical protein